MVVWNDVWGVSGRAWDAEYGEGVVVSGRIGGDKWVFRARCDVYCACMLGSGGVVCGRRELWVVCEQWGARGR